MTMAMDDTGSSPINHGDSFPPPPPPPPSPPPPPQQQQQHQNQPVVVMMPDRLVANDQNMPSVGVGGGGVVGVGVEETQPRMIGPQPPPPPPPHQQQQHHSHSQQRGQEQEMKQQEQDDDMANHQRHQQRQQQPQEQQQPPAHTLQLWNDVADNLAKHQTVIWVKAVDSLDSARLYLKDHPALPTPAAAFIGGVDPSAANNNATNNNNSQPNLPTKVTTNSTAAADANNSTNNNDIHPSNPGRLFIDKYMLQIISILLEQNPFRIGQMEKDCVEKSLRIALQIIKDDLENVNNYYDDLRRGGSERNGQEGQQNQQQHGQEEILVMGDGGIDHGGGSIPDLPSSSTTTTIANPILCHTIITLSHIFHKKKIYYKAQTRQWHNGPMVGGLPEVRTHMISVFRRIHGLTALGTYMSLRAGCVTSFPSMDWCKDILGAMYDSLPQGSNYGVGDSSNTTITNNSSSSSSSLSDKSLGNSNPTPAELQLARRRYNLSESKVIASAIMKHILLLDEITLKKMDTLTIQGTRKQLHSLYSRICDADGSCPSTTSSSSHGGGSSNTGEDGLTSLSEDVGIVGGPKALHEFFTFWRALALKLITSQSLPLKLFGWDEIGYLIFESEKMEPPPRAYRVSGAGTAFVNGLYEFDKKRVDVNGYKKTELALQYHRIIPRRGEEDGGNNGGGDDPIAATPSEIDGAGKTLTLFRCTMRSSHKWWFLSEADEDQPGTDKDIDYYQHKSKKDEESLPSHSGWSTCRAGIDPPPTLEAVGKLVPPGEECNTLERLLAKWAIENGVIELVLGDGIHREVVSRSAGLIKFLAGMCRDSRGQDVDNSTTMSDDGDSVNNHCLKASHLLLAWKTCTNKADAAVSAQIYHLLVSILPSLPSSLAIPLIEAVFASLDQKGSSASTSGGIEKQYDHFFEVSEFCGAIAEKMLADTARDRGNAANKQDPSHDIMTVDPVREAILKLHWAVLSHKDVLTLKSYESIKKFVSSEICKQDAVTDKLRITFVQHTCYEIKKKEMCTDPNALDETHALHMVQLAKFLLQGYGREGIEAIICPGPGKLGHHFPTLIFRDLMSYMKRRSRVGCAMPPMRKPSSTITVPEFNHAASLSTRLQILRFVYGLDLNPSTENELSCQQVQQLWNVCVQPTDREALMMFLANASKPDDGTYNQLNDGSLESSRTGNPVRNISSLSPCFSDNVYIFENLFCADVGGPGWENLGELAYQSFQSFDAKESRNSPLTTDALWRICLSAGNDSVAARAMNDLLTVYMNGNNVTPASEGSENSKFSQRIFDCLVQVKEGLKVGNRSSERSAERCIRILSAAIEKCNSLGANAGAVAERFGALLGEQHEGSSPATVEEYLNLVPHGMRGVYSCNTVSIIARATTRGGNHSANTGSAPIDAVAGDDSATLSNRPERFLLEIHPLQTLASIKHQIASHCNHDEKRMKLNNLSGQKRSANGDLDPRLSTLPDATLAADLGIVEGSEIIALLSDKIVANNVTTGDNVRVNNVAVHLPTLGPTTEHSKEHLLPSSCSPSTSSTLDLTGLFSRNGLDGSSNLFFDTLMSVLELLPVDATSIINNNGWNKTDTGRKGVDSHSLAWDLLSAMPTNAGIIAKVHAACSATSKATPSGDDMAVEFIGAASDWSSLLDFRHFERSVYVMQILDSFLRPAHVIFSSLPGDVAADLTQSMSGMAMEFRTNFIKSGGFEAVLRLFILSGKSIDKNMARRNKMGNECALRIIKECFFASNGLSTEGLDMINSLDGETIGKFLNSLVAITIDDSGASDHAILRVLKLVRMMLESGGPTITTSFTTLPGDAAETFLTSLLLWKGSGSLASTGFRSAVNIRKSTEEMILAIPLLSASALPWLVRSLKNIDPFTDGSDEFFSVLLKLVNSVNHIESASELRELGAAVCIKVASCPRPNCDTANTDHSTGVLCGCLNLLIALIEVSGDNHSCFLVEGARHITRTLPIIPWSEEICSESVEQWEHESLSANDKSIIDLMGAIFDGFISTARSSELSPICCDSFSRHLAFNVISAAAHACRGGAGYRILSQRINRIIANVAPALRHRWGANASAEDRIATRDTNSVLYSGLKNQGCTCYMNSVLQQLFMMPALRKNLCSAKLPTILRSSGGGAIAKGSDLVGNQISVHWENGNKYEAIVMNYNEATGMHTINYRPIQVATDMGHHNPGPDINSLPRDLLEEFILTEGRPGKETGAFEISSNIWSESAADESLDNGDSKPDAQETPFVVNESPDESSSRKLLEEVQRTFVNLEEARGRCFDPRSLVEASHCLKLEFDVWQQNDASEFAMKLLDRLEISLKKWSPSHFKYLAHTFGMKKTTQKICRECGLKTNREENMMNIDCQIRNKTSIHEALSDMCEDEIMEGDNKVLCETCQVKTNTVLRTAISALPDVLVLSLKRFDLDYTTFETVKLNSRCEFGEALNMKQYTLQAKEVLEAAGEKPEEEMKSESGSMMDLDETETKEEAKEDDPLSVLPDEDYEYRLAGVLVHAGVAQGGHYYSFIKDRTCAKWYRFDDEDVTPFDPCSIEHECFGGKVKKETKLPNGQSHTVVSEQFANALMLFYEKVKPVTFPSETEAEKTDAGAGDALMEVDAKAVLSNIESSDGFEVFLPGVRKSNSTHCWQSFLLTDEFQTFVKKLIDHCTGGNRLKSEEDSMDITPMSSPSPDLPGLEIDSWRLDVIRMSLSFVFDILFHLSSKKAALGDWSQTLIRIFSSSWDLSARFVSDLAKRSHHVYKNWIRAYTMECPEEGSRRAALQIFACAMHSLLSSPTEQTLLKNWTRGWSFQESKLRERACHQVEALPTKLELTELRPLEDTAELGVTATSLGVILSFLSELIEVSPRYSQANIDLCFFIRELADAKDPTVGKFLRDAMVESHFVTRLICLALSELSPLSLKYKFPGSSVPSDIAVAISRGESPLSVLVGTSNSGVHGQFGGSSQLLVETVGCLLGLPWIKQVAISYETGEINRGRAIRSLTQPAIAALTAVFEESKPPSSAGMTPRDIQFYLQKCGQHVPPQRIEQIFQRHAVDDPNGMRLLTLTGFLNYYRDAVHNSEYQVQKELHAFGFRPDLTRRSDDCRWYVDESGQKRPCSARESIANEIVMNRTSLSRFPALTEIGLHTLHFMNYACGCGINGAVEYLLAAAACGRKSQAMIYECLDYLHRHIGNWGGGNNSDAYSLIITVLTMLTAIPDEKQQARISMIMMNDESDAHLGLLIKGDHLIRDYPNDYRARMHAEKYSDFLRVLRKQHAVSNWMSRNRAYCAWIEPEAHPETVHPLQTRSDHPDRRSGGYQNAPEHLQNHNPNAEDDSGLDDDSRSDDDDDLVHDMVVDRCGVPEVNGVFRRDGTSDGVWKYTKRIRYRGREEEFSLYRCRLTDSTRRWYISIVPMGSNPGSSKDIDFYAAVPTPHDKEDDLPPRTGWTCLPASGGLKPPPRVFPRSIYDEEYDSQVPDIVVDQDQSGFL